MKRAPLMFVPTHRSVLACVLASLFGASSLAAAAQESTRGAPAAPSAKSFPVKTAPAPKVIALVKPSVGDTTGQRFDFEVSNAPAAQVFAMLSSITNRNVVVPQDLIGSITLSLKAMTFEEVMGAIRDAYGYDFKIADNRVTVASNGIQTRILRINYLNSRRQGSSEVRVLSGSIAQSQTANASNAGPVVGTGTTATTAPPTSNAGTRGDDSSRVVTTSDADFWRDTREALETLIGVSGLNGQSKGGRSLVMNPAAGVIVVRATPADIRQIEAYLEAVEIGVQRQVMIEAKIIEVSLSNEAQSGVNWSFFRRSASGNVSGGGAVAPGTTFDTTTGLAQTSSATINTVANGFQMATGMLGRGFYGLAFQGANFAALITFLETQGGVQVLSSPRIATLNNQKAVLKVGTDEFFVTNVSTSTTTVGSNAVTTPSISLQPFFSGIALDVTPQIDGEGNVTLHVHPSISQVVEKQKNVDLGSLGKFNLPLALSSVNESDSVVRLKDGQIVAIGGLMSASNRNDKNQIPGAGDLPVFGSLFGQKSNASSKRELVILIKPTIIREDGTTLQEEAGDLVSDYLKSSPEKRR